MRVNRMIGAGAAALQDASLTACIVQPAANLFGKQGRIHMVRTGGREQEPARRHQRRGEAYHLAVAARPCLQVFARFDEGNRQSTDF